MNKLIILLLAVCLVSVHAFVKRDAPETGKQTSFDEVGKQISDLATKISKSLSDALKPEAIQKELNAVKDNLSKAFENMKPSEAPKA